MRKVSYAISLLLAVVLGFLLGQSHTQRKSNVNSVRRVLYYVDPMHPAYESDKPGIAPDCGMELEPVYAEDVGKATAAATAQAAPEAVSIDSFTQQLLGIRVATVEKTSETRALRIPGRVTADETRVYRVNVGVDGFVKETHDDAVGSQVKKDQRLAAIYSPEFLSVTGGYLSASERTQGGTVKEGAAGTQGLAGIRGWADRLRNLGMSKAQIEELGITRRIPEDIYVLSPADGFIVSRNISPGETFERHTEFYRIADLSHVWIVADLFGSEGQYFHPGATARITLPNQKGSFSARVSNVLPQIDPSTRSLKVRLEIDNPQFALRPDMFVDVDLSVQLPPGLSVPVDALLDSGLRKRVFVDRGNGFFEPRQVDTGERFQDRVQILKGLAEGDRVVASGTFLLDSESRMRSSTVLPSVAPASVAKSNAPQ